MGMSIGAKLIVGLEYMKFKDLFEDEDELNAMLEYGEIDYSSPYYDSPRHLWYIGEDVGDDGITPEDQINLIKEASDNFFKKYKVQPYVYCCADVT